MLYNFLVYREVANMKTCHVCGAQVEDDAKFCPTCGAKMEELEVEIPTPKQPEEKEIELTLEGSLDAQLAKTEVEMDQAEEDLSDVLTASAAVATGTQVIGNAQAETHVAVDSPELEIPEETKIQQMAKQDVESMLNEKVDRETKTQQLIKELQEERERERQNKESEERRAASSPKATNANDNLMSVVSYLTWIGWAVSYFMTAQNRSKQVSTHLNRALVLNLLSIIMRVTGIGGIVSLLALVLLGICLYYAVTGSDKQIPILDDIKIIK